MFSEAKVTEIYCLADDFCKEFSKFQEKHMFSTSPKNGKHRNKPNRMSDAEIMLIMILFIQEVTDVSNTFIRNMSASIWVTCFHEGYHIIALLS